MNHRNRLLVVLDLIVICAALSALPSLAEVLPTKGKFCGIYQVNRSGVGRLKFFIFSKDLKEQMAPFENKYVEIEVLKARQPMNPGAVVIDQIGSVTRLPDPLLELRLKVVPSNSGADGSFDLVCMVTNHADKEIIFDADTLQIGVCGYRQSLSSVPDIDFLNSGYTPRQLGFVGDLSQVSNFLTPMKPGERTHFYSRFVTLRPREEVPFVIHGMRREPGEYELAATASYSIGDNKPLPLAATIPINLPVVHDNPKSVQPLKVESHFVYDDEWLVAEGVISDPSEMGVSVFTKASEGLHFLPGLVQIHTASGELLQADLDWIEPNGSWKKSLLEREGLHFKFRVRNQDRFSRVNIAKVGLWTVTSRGLERLILSDQIPTSTRPALPSWGASTHGCRMRIETPRTTFAAEEKVRFFVQAESDGSEADILWVNEHKFWSQVVATVDGKNARIETGGVSDAIFYEFPFQVDVELALIKDLTRGKHILQFSVQGDSGIYKNLRGKSFRKLNATLVSNVIEFEVR